MGLIEKLDVVMVFPCLVLDLSENRMVSKTKTTTIPDFNLLMYTRLQVAKWPCYNYTILSNIQTIFGLQLSL